MNIYLQANRICSSIERFYVQLNSTQLFYFCSFNCLLLTEASTSAKLKLYLHVRDRQIVEQDAGQVKKDAFEGTLSEVELMKLSQLPSTT